MAYVVIIDQIDVSSSKMVDMALKIVDKDDIFVVSRKDLHHEYLNNFSFLNKSNIITIPAHKGSGVAISFAASFLSSIGKDKDVGVYLYDDTLTNDTKGASAILKAVGVAGELLTLTVIGMTRIGKARGCYFKPGPYIIPDVGAVMVGDFLRSGTKAKNHDDYLANSGVVVSKTGSLLSAVWSYCNEIYFDINEVKRDKKRVFKRSTKKYKNLETTSMEHILSKVKLISMVLC